MFNAQAHARDQIRFDNSVRQIRETIANRLNRNIDLLWGTRGLFDITNLISKKWFETYLSSLNLPVNHPDIQGIGLAITFGADELSQTIQQVRAHDVPDFHVWPEGKRELYSAIVYLAPDTLLNRSAIGYDMLTESSRRAAMLRARDTGEAAASGKVELVQERLASEKQAGFLVYVPVYHGSGTPATVAERQKTLLGFIYSPYRADDLLLATFQGSEQPDIELQIYDGDSLLSDRLLHRSKRQRRSCRMIMSPGSTKVWHWMLPADAGPSC